MYVTDPAEILSTVTPELKKMLEPRMVLGYLLAEGVLSQSEFDRCREPQTCSREDQCQELINVLKQKGQSGYEKFCSILEKTQGNLKALLDITSRNTAENMAVKEKMVADLQKEIKDLKEKVKRTEKKHGHIIKDLLPRKPDDSSKQIPQDHKPTCGLQAMFGKRDNSGRPRLWFVIVLALACWTCTTYLAHHIGMNYGCSADLATAHVINYEQQHYVNHTKSLLKEIHQKLEDCMSGKEPMTEINGANMKRGAVDLIYKDLKKCHHVVNTQLKKLKKCSNSYITQMNTCSIWEERCKSCEKSSVLQWVTWTPINVIIILIISFIPTCFAVVLLYGHLESLDLHRLGFVQACHFLMTRITDEGLTAGCFHFSCCVCLLVVYIHLESSMLLLTIVSCQVIIHICLYCYGKFK